MMHFHRWSNWQDVKLADEAKVMPLGTFLFVRQVIRQQRRCSICNLVKTRTS